MPGRCTVDSEKLEYGPGTTCSALSSSLGFGAGGKSYSNFLAATVNDKIGTRITAI